MLGKKQNTKYYLPANKHTGSNLNLSSHTNLPYENCCFVGYYVSTRQKDFGILKMLSGRYVAKKWIDKVTKLRVFNEVLLTLIWVGFSGVRFAVEGRVKLPPVKNFLEVCYKLKIWYVSTHTCSFRKYSFWYQEPLNFADITVFLQKISIFWSKIEPLLKTIV